MSRGKKLAIALIGVALIVFGGLIFVIAMAVNGWNFNTLSNVEYKRQDIEYSDQGVISSASSLEFDLLFTDVEVTFHDGENIEIEYYQTVRKSNGEAITRIETVWEGGRLKFEVKRNILGKISIYNIASPTTKIKIPKSMECSLKVETNTGDISFGKANEEILVSGNLDLSSNTGKIAVLSNLEVNGNFEISEDTGDILISGKVNCQGGLSIDTDTGKTEISGDITASQIEIEGDTGSVIASGNLAVTKGVFIEVDTGRIEVNGNITARTNLAISSIVRFKSSTGKQIIKGKIMANSVVFLSSTGDIDSVAVITANQISATAGTGDVTLKLTGKKEDYSITVETNTGDKNISNSSGGFISLSIRTSTGDVSVSFAE